MKANVLVSHQHSGQAPLLSTYPPTQGLPPFAITGSVILHLLNGERYIWVLEEPWTEVSQSLNMCWESEMERENFPFPGKESSGCQETRDQIFPRRGFLATFSFFA